jgi:hypothetical protein
MTARICCEAAIKRLHHRLQQSLNLAADGAIVAENSGYAGINMRHMFAHS